MLPRVLALFLVSLVGLFSACATLREAEAPAAQLFGCMVGAFLPLAGTPERAAEVVSEVQAGRVDIQEILDAAQATHAEADALYAALSHCAREAHSALTGADAGTDADASDAGAQ